MEKDA